MPSVSLLLAWRDETPWLNNKKTDAMVFRAISKLMLWYLEQKVTLCSCRSKESAAVAFRHLGQSRTWNIRSSQSPWHGSYSCWMSWPALDEGNLLQPSSASTMESENCWPGLWLPWIICWVFWSFRTTLLCIVGELARGGPATSLATSLCQCHQSHH